ncbi:MAG: alginate export family protein [Acidobacteriota bacterium]
MKNSDPNPSPLRWLLCLMTTALTLALSQAALAQQGKALQPTPSAQPSPKEIRIGNVLFSGSVRARLENWNWFDTSLADDSYTFGAVLLRLSLSQKTEKIDWQVEGAFPALINIPRDAIAPAPQGQLGLGASYFAASGAQDATAILKQAFVRFKLDGGSTLRVGRFEFSDGNEKVLADPTIAALKRDHVSQRLIGTFGFSHIQRSFDGVEFSLNLKKHNLTLFAARPTEGSFQLNANKELDVDLYYGAFSRAFASKKTQSEVRTFAIHYHDGRGATKTDNRPLLARQSDGENIRITTVGGHFLSAVKAGKGTADVLLWGAGQFGNWGHLDHRAGAIAVEAGYQFPSKIKPWVRGGYFRSTGDGNAADGNHSTFFQILPTPRVYARFPFYNLMNIEDTFAQLRLKPHERLSLRTDIRYLRLSDEKDLWYVGGGAFQKNSFGYVGRPSGGNRSLGTLFDLSLDCNITTRSSLTFYIAGVRGGGAQSFIYPQGGQHPGARFLYLEFTQRF